MARFNQQFRDHFANKVCRHYDKYCEITNPMSFNPTDDIYRTVYSKEHWDAMQLLCRDKRLKQSMTRGATFDMQMPHPGKSWQAPHVTFYFDKGLKLPSLDVKYDHLEDYVKQKIDAWLRKAFAMKELRQDLWYRVDKMVEVDKWARSYTCNTPGQMIRLWPELQPFLPVAERDTVRNACVKSKLPDKMQGRFDTPAKFRCETIDCDPLDKRKFDALTHILLQMSLMTDVDHDDRYPSVYLS